MQLNKITFKGLKIAPSQVHGAIRIVPLLRHKVRGDLRLLKRSYEEDLTIVSLQKDMKYLSYVPHGLVMSIYLNSKSEIKHAKDNNYLNYAKRSKLFEIWFDINNLL